jgi:hypothetical protein
MGPLVVAVGGIRLLGSYLGLKKNHGVNMSATLSSPSKHALLPRLNSWRRRQWLFAAVNGCLWGLFVALLALLVAAWLDLLWELPAQVRAGALPVAGILGTGVLLLAIGRGWWAAGVRRLAAVADGAVNAGGEFLTGLDLAGPTYTSRAIAGNPSLTEGLRHMAVQRAADKLNLVSAQKVVPARPLATSALTLIGLLAAVGILCLAMPKLAQTQWHRFTVPTDEAPPFSLIEFNVQPGDVELVYGEGFDVVVSTNLPTADALQLVLRSETGSEESIPMFAQTDQQWRAPVTRVTEPGQYYIRAGRARSPRYQIALRLVPEIRTANYRLVSPAYTQLPPKSGELEADSISGLVETEVHLTLTSNRPLSGGEIKISSGDQVNSIPLQPVGADKATVSGRFKIEAAGTYEIHVTDVDGRDSVRNLSGSIAVVADQRPFVRLIQPRAMSLATPTVHLPVEIIAEDDFGIANLWLFRSLNDSSPMPMLIKIPNPQNRWREYLTLPLNTYGLSPGDVIKLFARVEDNDPHGAKGSDSPIHVIHIIDQAEFDRLQRQREGMDALMKKYNHIQRLLERLDNELEQLEETAEKNDNGEKLSDETKQAMEKMADMARESAAAVEQQRKQEFPIDLDRELEERLREIQKEMEQIAEELENLQKQAEQGELEPGELQRRLDELRDRLGQKRQNFGQQVMMPLEKLARVMPLLAMQDQFVQLVLQQRDLADRAKAHAEQDGIDDPQVKRRLAEMADEQEQLREQLRVLLEEIEAAATHLPDDPELEDLRVTALEFVAAVSASDAANEQMQAGLAFAEFVGSRGHLHADNAARILEEFLKKCEGMGGEACEACRLAFKPSLGCPNLGNSLEQLLQMMGMGQGQGGMGSGLAGSGFSQRRSGLSNMGMYGGLPTVGLAQSGRGDDREGGRGAGGTRRSETMDSSPSQVSARTTHTGAGAIRVPRKYERRVGEYFRRLADELGDEVFNQGDQP